MIRCPFKPPASLLHFVIEAPTSPDRAMARRNDKTISGAYSAPIAAVFNQPFLPSCCPNCEAFAAKCSMRLKSTSPSAYLSPGGRAI